MVILKVPPPQATLADDPTSSTAGLFAFFVNVS